MTGLIEPADKVLRSCGVLRAQAAPAPPGRGHSPEGRRLLRDLKSLVDSFPAQARQRVTADLRSVLKRFASQRCGAGS
jgi:hypothetical protein